MHHNEESHSGLGVIKLHKNVIASIASIAAVEIDGVKTISVKKSFWELSGKKSLEGIKVEFDKNQEVKIDVPLIIRYGFNVPEVANKVQENIRLALEKMTNLTIKDIDISVQGIERGSA